MLFNREEAAQRAEAADGKPNVPGMCQNWTWNIFSAHAVGDVDGDGDADAVDGWKSEPAAARHPGDRNPPRGVPVAYSGGSKGHGHRSVTVGNGMISSTDAGGAGRVAIVPLDWPEKRWGMQYLGWSETISGLPIPLPPVARPTPEPTRVSRARRLLEKALEKAKPGSARAKMLKATLKVLGRR